MHPTQARPILMLLYPPQPLKDETRALLAQASTASLTVQLRKRGIHSVFIAGVRALNPSAARFVGPAFTLRHIPMREDITRWEIRGHPEFPQRQAIEGTPPGHVLIMDCRGETRAGMAGDILVKRLQTRGVTALVADGPMRDAGALAQFDFPIFCAGAAAPASLTRHHAIAVQQPIACGGVAVLPGDILVGDADGVVVIPSNIADDIAPATVEQERFERFAQIQVARGRSTIGLYPPDEATLREYAEWRE